jgi:hypothetical protein
MTMDKNLIGYLLNALDDAEQTEVERTLASDAAAQARLEALRKSLDPLAADAEPPAPPPGLVLNTLAFVAEHACMRLPAAPKPRLYQADAASRSWFRRADVLAAACLLVLVAGFAVPAILRQWDRYHVASCQNNLRLFGEGLQRYADTREDLFPQVRPVDGPRGVAGVFVPMLLDSGMLEPGVVSVSCPAVGTQRPTGMRVAELEELYRSHPGEFDAMAWRLAPGYAYSLGYQEGRQYYGPHRDLGELAPLLSDRPGAAVDLGNSPNHGGSGQNVLHVGGHVRWYAGRAVGADDIYLNQDLKVLAGKGQSDSVLGASNSSPAPRDQK